MYFKYISKNTSGWLQLPSQNLPGVTENNQPNINTVYTLDGCYLKSTIKWYFIINAQVIFTLCYKIKFHTHFSFPTDTSSALVWWRVQTAKYCYRPVTFPDWSLCVNIPLAFLFSNNLRVCLFALASHFYDLVIKICIVIKCNGWNGFESHSVSIYHFIPF